MTACDSSTTGPADSWEAVSGSYAGTMIGLSQGVAMDATFSMTITQSRGDLGGDCAPKFDPVKASTDATRSWPRHRSGTRPGH